MNIQILDHKLQHCVRKSFRYCRGAFKATSLPSVQRRAVRALFVVGTEDKSKGKNQSVISDRMRLRQEEMSACLSVLQ
jgi:hypothetical protein